MMISFWSGEENVVLGGQTVKYLIWSPSSGGGWRGLRGVVDVFCAVVERQRNWETPVRLAFQVRAIRLCTTRSLEHLAPLRLHLLRPLLRHSVQLPVDVAHRFGRRLPIAVLLLLFLCPGLWRLSFEEVCLQRARAQEEADDQVAGAPLELLQAQWNRAKDQGVKDEDQQNDAQQHQKMARPLPQSLWMGPRNEWRCSRFWGAMMAMTKQKQKKNMKKTTKVKN